MEQELRNVVEEYKNAVNAQFNEFSDAPATEADLAMLASQVHVTLAKFVNVLSKH